MQELRKLFHAANNELHKATIHAGVLRHSVNGPSLRSEPLPTETSVSDAMIKSLVTIENSVMNAGKLLDQIKDIVYKELRIETNGPLT